MILQMVLLLMGIDALFMWAACKVTDDADEREERWLEFEARKSGENHEAN